MTMLSSDVLYNQLLAAKSLMLNQIHPCCKCGATFVDSKSLSKHQISHQKRKHECKECGKRFNSSSDLKRHTLIHTNTRPYKCHLCPTAFVQQAHLTRHLRSHTRHGVRFKCLGCSTMFLHSTNVRWHQQFCEKAKGTNGGYVVTQSEGEGLGTVSTKPTPSSSTSGSGSTTTTTTSAQSPWARSDNKVYFFNSNGKGRRFSSSSSTSTDSGSEPGSNSFLNVNKPSNSFENPFVKTELWRSVPESRPSSKLTPFQLSYLNSRVSMVAPKPLKHATQSSLTGSNSGTASTEGLLKLLASLQDGTSTNETSTPSTFQPPSGSSPSSYKIVPNKIIQHNVTSSAPSSFLTSLPGVMTSSPCVMTSSPGVMTSSPGIVTSSPGVMTSSPGIMTSSLPALNGDDKIKPILDLVKKLVAGGLRSSTADVVISAFLKHISNVKLSQLPVTSSQPSVTSSHGLPLLQPTNSNKRRLDNTESSNFLTPPQKKKLSFSPSLFSPAPPPVTSSPSLATPLSFTPLMFRQFPRVGDMHLPPPSSTMFSPPPSLASQLFKITESHSVGDSQGTTTETRKPYPEQPVTTESGCPRPIKKEVEDTCSGNEPMGTQNEDLKSSPSCTVKEEVETHDSSEQSPKPEQLLHNSGGEQVHEASTNIACHRLADLLSFV